MKSTEHFKAAIKKYLDERAEADELFAAAYAKPKKSLDECVNYILQQVRKQGYNGYTDEEIYGMAVHYYDEDDIKDIEPIKARVVVNHVVELTEEEKEAARKEAVEKYRDERTTRARHLVMWALHTCCKASKTQIGAAMGRNHATVLYALRAVDNAIETPYGGEVKKIVKLIKAKGEALV